MFWVYLLAECVSMVLHICFFADLLTHDECEPIRMVWRFQQTPGKTSRSALLMHFLVWKKSQLRTHQGKVISIGVLVKCSDLNVNTRVVSPVS